MPWRLKETIDEAAMMKRVQCAGFNEKRVAEQTELVKNAFELVYKHARGLAEMSAEFRNEALELLFAGLRAFAECLALSVSLLYGAAGHLSTPAAYVAGHVSSI